MTDLDPAIYDPTSLPKPDKLLRDGDRIKIIGTTFYDSIKVGDVFQIVKMTFANSVGICATMIKENSVDQQSLVLYQHQYEKIDAPVKVIFSENIMDITRSIAGGSY